MSAPTALEIAAAVAARYGVPLRMLTSESQRREYVIPRHMAMALAYDLCGYSLPRIGQAFNRDHSTVVSGIERTAQRRAADPATEATYQALFHQFARRIEYV